MGEKISKPVIFHKKESLPKGVKIIDAYQRSLAELFYIDNPLFKKEMPEANKNLKKFLKETKIKGIWIYFPWNKTAVYTVPEFSYFKLRTARNKDVITEVEQNYFRNSTIGVVGLSVGSVLLSSLVTNGGSKHMRIADFDEIEITNLNRMKSTLLDIGVNKAVTAAKNVWELDPFANIDIWDKGVSKDNLEKFIIKKPKLDVFIDTMDSLDLKILARLICKKHRIPVVMITENADNSIIDVERYDLNKDLKIFNGRIGNIDFKELANLGYKEWVKLAARIIGPDFLSPRMQDSILKLGKKIASVPQLSTSVSMGSAAATTIIRRIINKKPLKSGRYLLDIDDKIIPGYLKKREVYERLQKTKEFILALKNR